MTRAEIQHALNDPFPPVSWQGIVHWQRIHEALALELDKTCATCEYFNIEGLTNARCYAPGNWVTVPADGSGFCHRWEQLDTEAPPPVDSSEGDPA